MATGVFLKNLTDVVPFGVAYQCGFIPIGITRSLSKHTVVNLYVEHCGDAYKPAITIFSHGKRVPPMQCDAHCFDLSAQEGLILCVRGMRTDAAGKPDGFIVETYRQPSRPKLRVVK